MPSPDRKQIAVIEDDPVVGGTLVHRLEIEGYDAIWWQTGHDALEGLKNHRPDVVVCDIRLPDVDGEEIFLSSLPRLGDTPFLFVTAYGQIDQAVRLTKAGAVDYVAKPYAIADLLSRVGTLASQRPDRTGVLGGSPPMRRVEAMLRRVADIDSILLFTGESGVGKEVAARFVHQVSARAPAPFMAVNCAAIPHDLIESELFGHERGAFTSAQGRHLGYVERARDGVLFLDEVGDLPLVVQTKLLRLIQEREFSRVGGEDVLRSGARILCATNVDLQAAVQDGRFRKDLFYRLNVIPVVIPPLRDRAADIMPLVNRFIAEFAAAFRREVHGLVPPAQEMVLSHAWPGNVRELRNRVERAVALSTSPWLGPEHLFPETSPDDVDPEAIAPLARIRETAERHHIQAALTRAGGQVNKAAELLGVSRSTLFEKMKRLNVGGPD